MSIEPRQGWPRSGQAEGPTLRSKECGATPMCHHHLRSIENRQPRRATAKHSTKHDHGEHRRLRPGASPSPFPIEFSELSDITFPSVQKLSLHGFQLLSPEGSPELIGLSSG
jgi:hypothetical protein